MADRREPQPGEDDLVQSVQQAQREAEQAAEEAQEEELTDEEIEERARRKEKVAQLLSRGIINTRLDPRKHLGDAYDPDRVYEWIRENDADIDRAKTLGFRVETRPEEEVEEEVEGSPTPDQSKIRYGDVILMSIDRDRYELIEEVKEEKKAAKQDLGKQEYLRRARQSEPGVINPQGIEA